MNRTTPREGPMTPVVQVTASTLHGEITGMTLVASVVFQCSTVSTCLTMEIPFGGWFLNVVVLICLQWNPTLSWQHFPLPLHPFSTPPSPLSVTSPSLPITSLSLPFISPHLPTPPPPLPISSPPFSTPLHHFPTPPHLFPTPSHLFPTPFHHFPSPPHCFSTPPCCFPIRHHFPPLTSLPHASLLCHLSVFLFSQSVLISSLVALSTFPFISLLPGTVSIMEVSTLWWWAQNTISPGAPVSMRGWRKTCLGLTAASRLGWCLQGIGPCTSVKRWKCSYCRLVVLISMHLAPFPFDELTLTGAVERILKCGSWTCTCKPS